MKSVGQDLAEKEIQVRPQPEAQSRRRRDGRQGRTIPAAALGGRLHVACGWRRSPMGGSGRGCRETQLSLGDDPWESHSFHSLNTATPLARHMCSSRAKMQHKKYPSPESARGALGRGSRGGTPKWSYYAISTLDLRCKIAPEILLIQTSGQERTDGFQNYRSARVSAMTPRIYI